MSWKYKHFYQQRSYPADRDLVWEAARRFVNESLKWRIIKETSEGFTAEGSSFAHGAIANVAIQSAANGITVRVDLSIQRAGATGFMLFDVGGYYNIQIGHWLDGIQGLLHQKLSDGQQASPVPAPPPPNKTAACIFNGCLGFIALVFAVWVAVNLITSVIGLVTGNLLLIGKGNNLHVHGMWARIISALILLFGAWIVWRIKRSRRPAARV